jgi:hypothetical protein
MRHIETSYPPYIHEVSKIIGDLRVESNKELSAAVPKYSRGERESQVNALGVACEMIFSSYLTMQGVNHVVNKMLDDKPVVGYDILIDGMAFDVKGVRPDRDMFLVNYEAHNKPKGIDYYAFVRPSKFYKADIWIISKDEVSTWPYKHMGYTNAYYKSI